MKKMVALFILSFTMMVFFGCVRQPNCECSTTPVEEVAQVSPPEAETVAEVEETEAAAEPQEEVASAEAPETSVASTDETIILPPEGACLGIQAETVSIYSLTPTSTEVSPPSESELTTTTPVVVSAPPPEVATLEAISLDASFVSVLGNEVKVEDDRFTELVLICSGGEYTKVTIEIVFRKAFVAPSLIQAGCRDFYFRTASGIRSQNFHWPE
jgi:hypothetical protein